MMSTSLLTATNPSSTSPFSSHLHHHKQHHHVNPSHHYRHKRQHLSSILTSSSPPASATNATATTNTSCQQVNPPQKTARTRIATNPNASPSSTARVMAAAFLTQSLSSVFTVANLKAQLLAHHYSTQNISSWHGDDDFIDDSLFISGLENAEKASFQPTSPVAVQQQLSNHRRSSVGGLEHVTSVSVSLTQVEVEKTTTTTTKKKPVKQVRFADTLPGRELVEIRLFQINNNSDDETTTEIFSSGQSASRRVCRQQSITKMSPLLLKNLKNSLEERRVRASAIRNVNRVQQEDVFLSDDDDDDDDEPIEELATGDENSSDDDAASQNTLVKPVKTDSMTVLLEKRLGSTKLESRPQENSNKPNDEKSSSSASESDESNHHRFDIDNFSFEWSTGQLSKLSRRDLLTEKLASQSVKLVNLQAAKTCISGQIMVKNLCYHKRVFLSYTFDNWQSQAKLECSYEESTTSNENQTAAAADTFSFKFDLDKALILRLIDENFNSKRSSSTTLTSPSTSSSSQPSSADRNSPPSFRFEFAVGFETSVSCCFWDNNDNQNYHLDCFFKVSSPLRRTPAIETSKNS